MSLKNNLNDIVTCDISIEQPGASASSFDNILIVVPAPTGEGATEEKVFEVKSVNELLEYGFKETDVAYKAATIAFAQDPCPKVLFVAVRQDDESITETLVRADASCDFYGIHLTTYTDESDRTAAMTYAEANYKLYAVEYTDMDTIPDESLGYYRTIHMYAGVAGDTVPENNKFAALAWMAKCFGYTPGSETWAFKTLSGIKTASLTTSEKSALAKVNVTPYLEYAGRNITANIGGKVDAGEWIDVIRFRDWLKNLIQINVFNFFYANSKVPFNDNGIAGVESQILAALEAGQKNGGIDQTTYDDDGNEIVPFTVTVPLAASLTETEKSSRKLTGVTWTARLAGAIHATEIKGKLTN